MKFPTMDEFAQNVAKKALDEIEYNGKTLRQWTEIILATDNNVGTKLGTNLAEVGTDCISREQAIDALDAKITVIGRENAEAVRRYVTLIVDRIVNLPSAQPEIVRCKDCKHLVREDRDEYTPYGFYNTYWDAFCDKHWDKEQGEYIDVKLDDFCSFAERRTDG